MIEKLPELPKAMNKSEAECFADGLGRRFRLDFADVARL